MNEMNKIVLNVRKSDAKKIIHNLILLAVGNFEEAGKKELMEMSQYISEEDPQKALASLERYLEDLKEYRQQMEGVVELVEEHMFLDSNKVSINFLQGEKIPMDDINDMLAESKAEKDEQKRQIKDKIESKKGNQE
tara:strand:+ start:731 stop:1138 length:408 start_codon:yes stop_codon:yes gene_type:complete